MSERTWTDAHDDTDVHIANMLGLSAILYEVATDYSGLHNNDPISNGILALVRTINKGMERMEELHAEEWKLRLQVERKDAA
ncbi:hypothetical protein [Paracoccus rhizosphaerae]|uniref:Uncharacterized protein n=1 Tax=Paracoccus rhizosphaerae TaxID=1133347 RepID=A0ABV6CNL8_9RHOB|nr:hypothetical protein [Paracoccus rhizosphaerae]